MKRMSKFLFYFILILLLASCNTEVNENGSPNANGESQSTSKENPQPNVKGVEDVDVLNTHGSIDGIERMQRFYEDMKSGLPSDLRIVFYTIEGDPIVKDLKFNGESLEVKNDTTRDAYGSGGIQTITCGQLIEEVNPTNTSYIATECKEIPYGMEEILQIQYNMSQQDLFEIDLKYGENLENEINTKTVEIKKEDGTTEPLHMAENVKQELYKMLVFANYLDEKDFVTSCDRPNAIKYNLMVYINGGKREISWKDCDESLDGLKFTKIANYIITESEQPQKEKPEVIVQGYVLERKNNTLLIGEELNKLDYEWMKDEIKQMDMNSFIFDFTELEGVPLEEFQLGDKIRATIDGSISGSKPGRAKVKDIKKIE
ncbi:DUF4362 domain-containing protein [Mesobacillus boroniphilus]|uniref:DUF4362 domain-containing protein n=1 Tax=Mesobacillus boroniphilus TaxID=308892 RepID=A0A944CJW5_9BACI|nr:DUF4362 domain-containing protein [Mesobacillus boroniphilus]MBS8263716.1 DUF4362 domain-containing protein [Mesobacillus boroniphilus]